MRPSVRADCPRAQGGEIRDLPKIADTLLRDIGTLFLLEARLSGRTVLTMIALSVLIALLLGGAWLLFGAALTMALASLEAFSLVGAALTVGFTHLVLAGSAFLILRSIRGNLTFRESRSSARLLVKSLIRN